MKTTVRFLTVFIALLMSAQAICAITAEELAGFLGVSSWHTMVNLSPDSYTIEIFAFADGKISDANLIEVTKLTKDSKNDLTVVVGPKDGKYRFQIINSGGSYGAPTREPLLERTLSPHLPEKVQEGDFILFGEPLQGDAFHGENELHSYSKGYLLRIKKKG